MSSVYHCIRAQVLHLRHAEGSKSVPTLHRWKWSDDPIRSATNDLTRGPKSHETRDWRETDRIERFPLTLILSSAQFRVS
jgi:hypothetical protein